MRDPFPNPPEGTPEQMVRRQLDEAARAVDGDAVVDRAFARLDAPATLPLLRRRWRTAVAAGLVAASVALGLLYLAQPVVFAGPDRLVEEALQANATEVDRGYLLQVQRLGPDGEPFGPSLRESHLWTRGDRYRIDALGPERGSFGQDENRRIWAAPTRAAGAYYDPDEAPEKLALASDLRTLRVDLLLAQLTRNFDLRWDAGPPDAPGTRRILALPRGERPAVGTRQVVLEVEPGSKVVRRLVVDRVRPTVGPVRITLVWFGNRAKPDAYYHLDDAVEPAAPRYDRGQPLLRGKVIFDTIRRFGSPVAG